MAIMKDFNDITKNVMSEFGNDIITDPRFVNILADYDAFAESRQMRMVVKEMIEQGFTKRILDIDYSSVDVSETIGTLVYEALNIFPFREDLVSSFISALIRCLAEGGNTLAGKHRSLKTQKHLPKETPLEFFEISEDGKILIEADYELSGEIVIPSGIEVIGEDAFIGNSSITKVVFPEGVKIIGNDAFEECTNLKSVQLPASLEVIEDYAFYKNGSIAEIVLPDGIKRIGESAFEGCAKLRSIHLPESLEEIGSKCFAGCCKLVNIFLPKNVQITGGGIGVGNIEVDPDNNCLKSIDGAILSKDGVTLYCVPGNKKQYVVPNGVKELHDDCFCNCEKLETITLPRDLKIIRSSWHWCFSSCKKLQEIEIPDGIETIQPDAFSDLHSLKELVIPDSVKWICDRFFHNSGVKKIIFKSLNPENIKWGLMPFKEYDWGYVPYFSYYVPFVAYEKYIQLNHFKDLEILLYDRFIPLGENPQSHIDKSLMGFMSKEDFCHIGDIILGKTTWAEAKRLGYNVEKHENSVSRLFNGKHGTFWDHKGKGRFDSFSYCLDGKLPTQWEECGLYHDLSYDSFISLFRQWGFIFEIIKYSDSTMCGFRAISYDNSISFNFTFCSRNDSDKDTITSSPNTLFSFDVSIE